MHHQRCGCAASALFERAIDLIDPPRWPSPAERDGDNDKHQETKGDEDDTGAVKRVKFDVSTRYAPKEVTAIDAINAYDLLVHAASMSSSLSRGDLTQMDWSKLRRLADIYRALLVTTCLLLELLSQDAPIASASSQKDGIGQPHGQIDGSCPFMRTADHCPALSPTITKRILSTSRRCILLLQALERICSEKKVLNINNIGGGDDINDYDRSEHDLVSNYDWHDDGHLPLPFCQSKVLYECCYLPIQQDPPCSKYERNAWTRDMLRGERLVSVHVGDYLYHDHCGVEIAEDIPLPDAPCISGSNDDDVHSKHTIVFSERSRKKRRRSQVEDRNAITKEGFLLISCSSFGAVRLHDDERISINDKTFIRAYCKLYPSGFLSIEDRSIRLKTTVEIGPLIQRIKFWNFFVYSGTTCQPFLPNGTMSFHFRLEAVRFLGSSTISNHESERNGYLANDEANACKLFFAVDEGVGSTFVDGYEWVNALSGAVTKASSLRDQICLEWDGLER